MADPKEEKNSAVPEAAPPVAAKPQETVKQPKKLMLDLELQKAIQPGKHKTAWDCTLKKGQAVGGYEVLSFLGGSGITEVYKVRNTLTGNLFAMKLLAQPGPGEEKHFENKFFLFRRSIENRMHQNIVHVYKAGKQSGIIHYYYIVEDFVVSMTGRTETLAERLKNGGKLNEYEAKNIALQIGAALDYAHTCEKYPFLHSNLKPSNVFLDAACGVKVADFDSVGLVGRAYMRQIILRGLSLLDPNDPKNGQEHTTTINPEDTASIILKEEDMPEMTVADVGKNILKFFRKIKKQTPSETNPQEPQETSLKRSAFVSGTCAGIRGAEAMTETFDYMSPEQKIFKDITVESNIYSYGLILYRMLTGHLPGAVWIPPSKFGVSSAWDRILSRALKLNPEERYWSIDSMMEDIRMVNSSSASRIIGYEVLACLSILTIMMGLSAYKEWRYFRESSETFPLRTPKSFLSIRNNPMSKFLMTVKVVPEGAGVQIRDRYNRIAASSKNVGKDGLSFFAERSKYTVSVNKEGYLSYETQIAAAPDAPSMELELVRKSEMKPYAWDEKLTEPVLGKPWKIPVLNMNLLPVEPAEFTYGTKLPDELMLPFEKKAVSRKIEEPFWLCDREVTQRQYREIMGRNPSFFKVPGDLTPVERVSWNQAVEFCSKLTERERNANRLPPGMIYRLPTELEWEYCAKAGTNSRYTFGDSTDLLAKHGFYAENSAGRTHLGAYKLPNVWGFYDMSGNVWEWCSDVHYIQKPGSVKPIPTYVVRGGAWNSAAPAMRVTSRYVMELRGDPSTSIGFRVVLGKPLE